LEPAYKRAFGPGSNIIKLGSIDAPTGRVVSCDPFFVESAIPFERKVAPGEYEVQLSLADLPDWGRRVAMARVLIRPHEDVHRFEQATMELTDSNRYFVDSGLGSFMDELTRQRFAELLASFYQARPEGNYYDDVLAAEFKRSAANPDDPQDVGSWNMHIIRDPPMRIAMFSSGLGDGAYESFWALGEKDEPLALVTDFGILE
jgi:Protein of unknown function (DUF4241)